ncbi:2-oxoglutarate dehydrogenase, E2 component, dihydrolipoamide succinyltransferase [Canibacter zhoujuaniae]|uniref:2-oxoglutarate dehydrogenase, E2 component, dihydrolipoamide succinyltransferase n=1 Tax=Canibacter zhoujuaniae TaxID=2708343 RepID=UPI00142109E7
MSQEVVLPALGESVTEGTVTQWLKQVGDSVEVDEPLLEVSTDKVDTEVPSPIAGVIEEILVAEDETVEVGAVLARVGDGSGAAAAEESAPAEEPTAAETAAAESAPAEEAPEKAAEPAAAETSKPAAEPAEKQAATAASAAPAQGFDTPPADTPVGGYVTPIVRKLAQQLGVDLSQVKGTGIGGRIRKEDVKNAAANTANANDAATSTPAPAKFEVSELRGTTQAMSRLRKVVASRAVESLQQTAQLTTVVKVDVTKVANLRNAKKDEFLQKTGNKLSFLPFFALAAVEALQTYPIINSYVDGENIVYPAQENLSIAVDTERGLLTPVIKDAAGKNIAELANSVADLAARTRDNKIKPDELSGGTFTLTNTGSRGALFDTPLVFLPQSAILGTGAVVKEPGVFSTPEGDAIGVRSYVYLALSYDHRTIDGADAARFLTQIKKRLEEGNFEGNLGI